MSGDLTLNGSTSMAKVCQALGEAFMAKYPDVTVTKSGNGSGDAPEAVNSGTALIGDLSRNLKDEENPDQFEINQIAIDGIAIAVNKDNPVTELTSEQITQIFTGEITNWKDLGGNDQAITVIGREAAPARETVSNPSLVAKATANMQRKLLPPVRLSPRSVLTRLQSATFPSTL